MDLSRLVVLLVVPALAPALVTALPDPAQAATPTCQGRPATIVGNGQASLVGTAGNDVIVTRGAQIVGAGQGDDLVCITWLGTHRTTQVSSGKGEDHVVNTAGHDVLVDLGPGEDTYVGGPGDDDVSGGDSLEGSLDERDVIATGAGDDVVSTGAPRGVLADDVDLGSGRDQLYVAGRVAGDQARFVAGTGSDQLLVYGPDEFLPGPPDPLADADVVVTNTATTGTETADGDEVLSWDGFERFAFNFVASSYRFVGSDLDEEVESYALAEARMGGGDDVVRVRSHPAGTTIDGGSGRDFAELGPCAGTATALLTRDSYTCQDQDGTAASRIPGIEDLAVVASTVDLRGTSGPELLVAEACHGAIHGYGGNDRLRSRALTDDSFGSLGCRVPANGVVALNGGTGNDRLHGRWGPDRLVGGSGRDVMSAGPGRDTLLGGPGRDRAYAGRDRDTCRAEVEVGCELS